MFIVKKHNSKHLKRIIVSATLCLNQSGIVKKVLGSVCKSRVTQITGNTDFVWVNKVLYLFIVFFLDKLFEELQVWFSIWIAPLTVTLEPSVISKASPLEMARRKENDFISSSHFLVSTSLSVSGSCLSCKKKEVLKLLVKSVAWIYFIFFELHPS